MGDWLGQDSVWGGNTIKDPLSFLPSIFLDEKSENRKDQGLV